MSANQNNLMDQVTKLERGLWRSGRQVAALLAVGILGAGAALGASHRMNHEPGVAGQGCWNSLRGALRGQTALILAVDENFNLQGWAGGNQPKDAPAPGPGQQPEATATIEVAKFGTATVYCYTIDGKRKCIED